MKGGSRVTQLILTHHYWTKALDDACQMYAAFLDFSKAFNSVSLSLVLKKKMYVALEFVGLFHDGPVI